MVLHELGKKINHALSQLTKAPVIDEKILDSLLKEICSALLESDVNVKLVQNLRNNIKQKVPIEQFKAGQNKRKIIQQTVFQELVELVDPGIEAYKPQKGRSNVIMFVGLQGSGKTTSCTKLAFYYQKKGWKVALVGADTFRAGAFDQLKQNATKARIPFYGSYTELDPVKLAKEGVEKFKKENFEIIIVDTSGRHKQEEALFEEMQQIQSHIRPDNVIFVLDGTIGQAADAQARAFHQSVQVGSIILTKMDGGAKGGGAISAVAATKSPIVFIGTGEHMHDLEPFKAQPFVSKMLGMGDLTGLLEKVSELNIEDNKDMMKRLSQGQFSLKDLKEQFQYIMQLGPLNKIMGMIPGMSEDLLPKNSEQDQQKAFRKMLCMLDSMTEDELNSDGRVFAHEPTRVLRISKGSGAFPEELEHLLRSHKAMSDMVKRMGGGFANMGGNSKQMMQMMQQQQAGGGSGMPSMNPQMMKQLGLGNMNLQDMMQKVQEGGIGSLLSGMMQNMQGGGRGGGAGPHKRVVIRRK